MWIEEVYLRNVRSFEKANLKLSKGINVIIGHNNSGKSTIIRSIDRFQGGHHTTEGFVRNGESMAVVAASFEGDGVKYFSYKNQSGKLKRIVMEQNNTSILLANREKQYLGLLESNLDVTEEIDKIRSIPIDENGDTTHDSIKLIHPFSSEEPNNVFYAAYGRKGYIDSNISEESTRQIRQDLGNLTSRLHKLNNPAHPSHSDFNSACDRILGFTLGTIAQGKNSGSNLTIGIYTDNIDTININNMGQGVGQVLGLLSILYTQKAKIILLEEIETDLHPQALKQLLDIVAEKSNENQFIISTHSNIVLKHLGSLSDTKIFQTSWEMKKGDGISLPYSTVKEIPNDPQNRLQVLAELGYDLIDFELWQGYLLFEESTAERIVRDYLIPVFFPYLVHKVRTIAAQGVNDLEPRFKDFLRLFVFIHLSGAYMHKAWVIVDGDDAGKTVRDSLEKNFPDWDESHFISLSHDDFELYYPKRFAQKGEKVLSMPHGQKKQDAKAALLREVIDWTRAKPAEAKKEFETSAKEVIEILKSIDRSLK
ncbi:MAG: AAA family ATPase [Imperialibacter sp.]|uniref:ATP-dependent nuclease n=1 Tax=Imperialibacter sp. TaxID=2038411 RepID=UPI0032EE7B7E